MNALEPLSPTQLSKAEAKVSQLKANLLNVLDWGGLDAITYP
jgi:hypothetical protein